MGSTLLSFNVMVPSKSVKKMHLGLPFKVSGKGILRLKESQLTQNIEAPPKMLQSTVKVMEELDRRKVLSMLNREIIVARNALGSYIIAAPTWKVSRQNFRGLEIKVLLQAQGASDSSKL
jgi:hypothetical protein